MNSMPGGPTQRDPPPYAYSSLSPPRSPPPTTKTSISPPPRESTFSPIPDTPTTSSHVPTTPVTSELPQAVTESRELLLGQDARFADVILTHVVLPRARVGILRCKDKLSFAFIPQTEDDVATTFVTGGLICRPRKTLLDIGLNMMKSWGFRRRSTGIDIMLWRALLGRD
jgi:hypothetical protein